MRLYGKKFIRQRISEGIKGRQETREGIVWSIDQSTRTCTVKIQGSNEEITATFPDNVSSRSHWAKLGTAVQIVHTAGERGRIEVVAPGKLVPTAISGDDFPDTPSPVDAILDGCEVTECPNNPGMKVLVFTGTYRIDNTEYTLDSIPMTYGDEYAMGSGGDMEDIAGCIAIDAAPGAGYFRYDLIQVGEDGIIDYVVGTPSSVPEKPAISDDHIALNYILIYSGMTEVRNTDIGKLYVAPFPSILKMTIADQDLAWDELTTEVLVEVLDQYGNPIYSTGIGWVINLEIATGNGYLGAYGWPSAYGGNFSCQEVDGDGGCIRISANTGSGNSFTFTYTRYKELDDSSPMLLATLEISYSISAYDYIILYDEFGIPMWTT